MAIFNRNTIKFSDKLIIKFINGKKYLFYMGKIVSPSDNKTEGDNNGK